MPRSLVESMRRMSLSEWKGYQTQTQDTLTTIANEYIRLRAVLAKSQNEHKGN